MSIIFGPGFLGLSKPIEQPFHPFNEGIIAYWPLGDMARDSLRHPSCNPCHLEGQSNIVSIVKNGSQFRMIVAISHGITRDMLYALSDKWIIEQVSRGVYRLKELHPISNPDKDANITL